MLNLDLVRDFKIEVFIHTGSWVETTRQAQYVGEVSCSCCVYKFKVVVTDGIKYKWPVIFDEFVLSNTNDDGRFKLYAMYARNKWGVRPLNTLCAMAYDAVCDFLLKEKLVEVS